MNRDVRPVRCAIRSILGYSSNQFNPYRDRLIKAGITVSPRDGILEYALPWFGEYAKECGE